MNYFGITTFWRKKNLTADRKRPTGLGKKNLAYLLFLILISLFYALRYGTSVSGEPLLDTKVAMEGYGESLRMNMGSVLPDTIVINKEREQLLTAIEERIVTYLYRIPDYSYINSLKTYLRFRPKLLEQFPSAVPLEKGDYFVSSSYGIRSHPISGKSKKHFGIDMAAPLGKPVYASASGTVLDIVHSKNGYGMHIIIKHRFGFRTLYGHLSKILVSKGQSVEQHELIGTVGSTGSSTGYHLHYEILKNEIQVDPMLSLNLKKTIYTHLIEPKPENDGRK
ncbi:hypothetical protein LCGC14_0676290 [marine sediment metagenome]|uniref:M23 family metallopeptidase n=2 Tax=root TaxID=1 RepID=A0A831QU52_9FLAO|nr:M23 family metallopeptidase [Pricia antarctica]